MRRLAALACIGMLLLVGCRDRSTPQNKSDKLCVEMGEIDGTITQMTAHAATGTPEAFARFRALRDRLPGQWAEVEEASMDVTSYQIGDLRNSYNKFLQTVSGVNDAATMAAKYPEIDVASGEFATVRLEAYNNLGCA
ncbi:MAG: hypothetical protein ACRD2W_14310 [Acidimicrobiales bacterium]